MKRFWKADSKTSPGTVFVTKYELSNYFLNKWINRYFYLLRAHLSPPFLEYKFLEGRNITLPLSVSQAPKMGADTCQALSKYAFFKRCGNGDFSILCKITLKLGQFGTWPKSILFFIPPHHTNLSFLSAQSFSNYLRPARIPEQILFCL